MATDQEKERESHLAISTDNVDRCRNGQARLRFVSPSGEPVKRLEVHVTQKTQDFLFGNLIFDLVWGDPPYKPEARKMPVKHGEFHLSTTRRRLSPKRPAKRGCVGWLA